MFGKKEVSLTGCSKYVWIITRGEPRTIKIRDEIRVNADSTRISGKANDWEMSLRTFFANIGYLRNACAVKIFKPGRKLQIGK